jgi:hypothetical protein
MQWHTINLLIYSIDKVMHVIKCKISLKFEHKDKLLAPKWDSFQKHVGQKNINRLMKRVKKGNGCNHINMYQKQS